MTLEDRRKDHGMFQLIEEDLPSDPLEQFREWLDDALRSDVPEANAMVLATATPDGRPSARMVLLRGADEHGFTFFTNYESRKANELEANPNAALLFFWPERERQVRIEGRTERAASEVSDRYFRDRPRASKLSAWASPQSRAVASRTDLEARLREIEGRFPHDAVPRPANWGGYRLVPETFEFWQGGPGRLHDRIRYFRHTNGHWAMERLAP